MKGFGGEKRVGKVMENSKKVLYIIHIYIYYIGLKLLEDSVMRWAEG